MNVTINNTIVDKITKLENNTQIINETKSHWLLKEKNYLSAVLQSE